MTGRQEVVYAALFGLAAALLVLLVILTSRPPTAPAPAPATAGQDTMVWHPGLEWPAWEPRRESYRIAPPVGPRDSLP